MHDDSITPQVLFIDDDVLVVDKPGGMPSVPARTEADPPDVGRRLAGEFGPIEAVHRLDRDTSGLLLLARNRAARVALGVAFEAGRVSKAYLAIVAGRLPAAAGTIAQPLAADRERPPRQRVDPILGRRATTNWRVLATDESQGSVQSLVELEPVTGRSHQLRVHLAWLGCPVLHDPLYAPAAAGGGPGGRLALRSMRLVFPHPRGGHPVAVEAGWPTEGEWPRFAGHAGQR
jgi:tRNA pseudouridine32 synthase/23S rRNA pseudouridine746 synthase